MPSPRALPHLPKALLEPSWADIVPLQSNLMRLDFLSLCLDRLHLIVAPIVLGSGRVGLALPPIKRADQALRAPMHVHRLDDEVLFDCDLSAQRMPAVAQA